MSNGRFLKATLSGSGRFVVLDGLHLDRDVFESLASWAKARRLPVQDAIQIAIAFLGEAPSEPGESGQGDECRGDEPEVWLLAE